MNNLQLIAVKMLRIMALSLACSLFVMPALAAGSEDESESESEVGAAAAKKWLESLETALEQTSYRGVFVYARGVEVNTMRIVHRYRDGMVTERLSQLDGGNGEIIRHGSEVVCILPNRGRLELDGIIPSGPFAGAFADRLEPMSRWYRPQVFGDGKIAGFDAVVIGVTAKDQHRYSYRLWVERETGLLLKSQVREKNGDVLERFQFTELEIVEKIADSEFEVPIAGRDVKRLSDNFSDKQPNKPPANAVVPAQAGEAAKPKRRAWQLGWTPDGFVAFKGMEGERHRLTAFSDGMASFSVFVEPLGAMDMPVGASRIGATTAYLHKISSPEQVYLVTVVGEIPPKTAMRVAESVTLTEAALPGNADD